MKNTEIERRFLISELPDGIDRYNHKSFVQGYLSTEPVVRVRREGEAYVLTYKGRGLLVREEHNLPLTKEAFEHLILKADGYVIEKTRYFIPEKDGLCIELDVFDGKLSPLMIAEVEFTSTEEAKAYQPPDWFGREVTEERAYSNSTLSRNGLPADFSGAEKK